MDKPYGCHLCDIGFSKLNELKPHLDSHENQPTEFRFRCEQCPASFMNKQYLILHQASAHTEQDTSSSEQIRSSQEEKAYKCDQCDKSFIRVGNFRTHMKWHENGEDHFKCNLCNRKFLNQENLLIHERVHSGNTPYQCGFCSKSYSTIKSLRIHQNRMHKNSKKHGCDQCFEIFTSMVKLNIHRMKHFDDPTDSDELSGESSEIVDSTPEQYVCNICNKMFRNKRWLEDHKKIHEITMFPCSFCDRFFESISDLKQHEIDDHLTHRNSSKLSEGNHNIQSYKCDICNKEFIRKPLLDAHVLQHTRQKPFGCNFCSSSFQFANELQMHLRTHKHLRPFSCKLCHARFGQHNQLKTHIRHMHTGLSRIQLTRSPSTCSTEDTSTEDNESDTVTVSSVVDSETDIYVLATSDEQGISTVSTDDEDTDNEAVKHFNPMSKSRQREADEMEKKIDSSQKGPVSFLLFGKLEDLKQNEFLYGNRTNPKISTQPDISLNRYDKFEEHFELWENGVSSTVRSLQNRMNKINQSLQGSFNSSGLSEYGRLNQAGDQMIDLPKLSNYAGTDNLLSWPSPQHITLFENIDISEFSDDSTDSKPRRRKFSGRSIMSSGSHIGLKAVNPDNSTYMTKEENLSSDLSQLDHAKNSNTPNFHLKSAIDKQDTMLKFHSEREEDVKKGVSHFSLFPDMSKHTVATKGRFTKDIIGNDVSSQSTMNNQNLEMYGMKPNDNLKGQFTGKGSSLLHENVTDCDRKFSQNMSENLSGKYFSGKTEICKQFRPKLQSSACLSPKSNYSSDMSDYHGNIQEDNKHSPFKSFIQSYKKRMFQKSDIKKKIRNGHQNSKRYDSENEISFARPNIVKKESSSKRGFDKTGESDTCDSEVEISFKRPNIKITIRAPKETNENVDSSDNEISFSKKKKQNNDVFIKAGKNVESSDNEISFSKKKKHKDGVFIKADQNVSFFLAKPMLGYCSSVDECSSLDNDLADQTTIEDCSSIDSDDRKSMSSHGSYLADDSTVPDDDATPERTPSENSSSSDIESNFDHDYLWDLGYEGENSSMENTLQGASCMYSPASGQSEDGSILDDDNLMTDNCSSIESDIEIDIPHQKLHSKRCMKKKKMWLKKNFKFEISKFNNRPFISNAFYQKDSVEESRALHSAVSKIRKKYGENNSILEDKVANIREIVKRRYFKMKKKSSANSSRESSTNKLSPVQASLSSNVKLKNHKKTSLTKVSQYLNMNRIRKKKNSQSLEESSRDTDYSFTETLSPKLDIHPMNMMKEPTIRACQPLVEKRANNGDTPSVASGKMPVIKSPIHKTRYAEVKIAKKKLNHNSDVGSSDVGTSENEASHTEEVCILSPPDIFDNYVCKQGLLKQSTRNISEDNRSVKGSSIKSPLYIKSPRYKTRYASQRLAKKRMRNERDNTQYASSHKSQGSIRLTSPIHNTQYGSSHKSQGSFRLTSPIHNNQYASSHKSQSSFRLTSPVQNTQYASLGPFFNLKSPIYKTRFATRRIAQKRMAIESGKLTNFNTKQSPKGIVYGPTPTSVGTIQTKKRKLSTKNEDLSNVTKNVKSKSQSTDRRSRPRKRDDAACRRKPPKQNGHVHKVPKPKIISQSNLETCNTLVDATVPKTRSGRPVKSPDRYKKLSECTVKLNRVPRQKYTRLQRNDLQKDTPFQDIPEKEKKKSKSRKTRNNSIRKTQKDLSRNNMENFEVIGIEEAETILSNQIREQKVSGYKMARKVDSLNGNKISAFKGVTDKISFLQQKNKTMSPKRKRNKLNKECTNNLSEKKKELDENCSMRNKFKRQESYDTSSIGSIAVYEGVDLDKYIGNESSDSQENFTKNGGCDTYMSDLKLFGRNLDMAGQKKTEERNKFEKYKTGSQQETLTIPLLRREINENTIQMTNGQQNDKICQSEQALPYNIQGYKTAVSEFVVPTVENTRSKCKEREKLMKEMQITHANVREDLKTAVENKKRNIVSNKNGSVKLNKGMNKKDTNMGSAFHPTCSTIYTNKNDENSDKNEVVKPCIIQKLKDKMGSIVGDLMKNSLKKNQAKKSSLLKVPVYKRNNYDKGAYVPLDRLDS